MRTNPVGFALTVGMGLLVLLLGFLGLSATGLVGYAADEREALQTQAQPNSFGCATSSKVALDSSAYPVAAMTSAELAGDALFKANCVQCHAVQDRIVGPALANITKRRSMAWIVPWVQNSAKMVADEDEYAVKLFNDNGKQQMPSFDLTKREIEDIVAWINSSAGGRDRVESYTIRD